jgi:hypothetical protein
MESSVAPTTSGLGGVEEGAGASSRRLRTFICRSAPRQSTPGPLVPIDRESPPKHITTEMPLERNYRTDMFFWSGRQLSGSTHMSLLLGPGFGRGLCFGAIISFHQNRFLNV